LPGRGSRRSFLKTAALAAAGATVVRWQAATTILSAAPQVLKPGKKAGPKRRPDLLHENSPRGLEVIQLTTKSHVPGSHLYMEAQVFTMDS
jgi:hypothetical protein